MKPARKDMPQIIALGVLVAVVLGYGAYTVTARGTASKKPTTPTKQASAREVTPAEQASLPTEYVGRYVGRYVVNDDQSREWAGRAEITVDGAGAISGHVWLPSSDGGPGMVSIVTGQVQPSGVVSLRSDRAATGSPDGKLQGTPIDKFQFRHTGRVEESEGRIAIAAEGKGNQGFAERLTANRMHDTQQVAQATAQPASQSATPVAVANGRDPFAPCLVPEQFRDQKRPPAQPAQQLAKLPTFSSPTNVALGIRPLPPVPNVDAEAEPLPERDPDFVVTGVIVGPVNVAIVRAGSERYIVREGQTINGKYLVKSITRDLVVLRNKHNQIYLKLGGSANAS